MKQLRYAFEFEMLGGTRTKVKRIRLNSPPDVSFHQLWERFARMGCKVRK
jgi:hypothetical protein